MDKPVEDTKKETLERNWTNFDVEKFFADTDRLAAMLKGEENNNRGNTLPLNERRKL